MSDNSIVLHAIEYLTYRRYTFTAHLENGVLKTKDGGLVYLVGRTQYGEEWPPFDMNEQESYWAVTDPELIKMASEELNSHGGTNLFLSGDAVTYISEKYVGECLNMLRDFRLNIHILPKGRRFSVVPGDGLRQVIPEIIYQN